MGGPPAVAGGPGGRTRGKMVVRVKVSAWNVEKMMYGTRATVCASCVSKLAQCGVGDYAQVTGFADHQWKARMKY